MSELRKFSLCKLHYGQNVCCENEFYLHENKQLFQYINSLTLSLALIQRLRKWPYFIDRSFDLAKGSVIPRITTTILNPSVVEMQLSTQGPEEFRVNK